MSSQIRNAYVTIYSSNDKTNDYTTQGFGVLSDLLKGVVHAKLNGALYFEGTYPAKAPLADKIAERNIIQCYVDENKERQLLRIYNVQKSMLSNLIEFKAEPIWNDTRKHVIHKWDSSVATTAQASFDGAKKKVKPAWDNHFKFQSSVSTVAKQVIEKANMLEFFGGKEGSVLDAYHGEFVKDNHVLRHVPRLGEDHKLKAVYTKNMTGLDFEIDSQSVLIGVYPYVKLPETEEERDPELHIKGEVLYTEYADQFPSGIVQFVEFKDIEKEADLRRAAQAWLTQNKKKQSPTITGSIEFVALRKQKGYEKFVDLEKVSLGDGVDVWHPDLEIEMSARIVEYDYNVLTDAYEKVVIGEVKANFLENQENKINTIGDIINKAIDEMATKGEMSDLIEEIVDGQTDLITGQTGGYVVLDPKIKPRRILIMDTPDKLTARNVIQLNNAGIGFSKNGVNGRYENAWTIDGHLNASFITSGILKAINIEGVNIKGSVIDGSTIRSVYGKYETVMEKGEFAFRNMDTNRDIMRMRVKQQGLLGAVGDGFNFVFPDTEAYSNTWSIEDPRLPQDMAIAKDYARTYLSSYGGIQEEKMKGWYNGYHNRFILHMGYRKSTMNAVDHIRINMPYDWGSDNKPFTVGNGTHEFKVTKQQCEVLGDLRVRGNIKAFNVSKSVNTFNTATRSSFAANGDVIEEEVINPEERHIFTVDAPQALNTDVGKVTTNEDGMAIVEMNELFLQTVNTSSCNYHVMLSPYSNANAWASYLEEDRFTVNTSEPNVTVSWQVIVYEDDYEDLYMPLVNDESMHYRKGGKFTPERYDEAMESIAKTKLDALKYTPDHKVRNLKLKKGDINSVTTARTSLISRKVIADVPKDQLNTLLLEGKFKPSMFEDKRKELGIKE